MNTRKAFFLLTFLLVSSSISAGNRADDALNINPPNCGKRPLDSNKLVSGTQTKTGDWAWQVLISTGSFICGGSLINSEWVVTAAHCAYGQKNTVFSIRLGVNDRSDPESWSTSRTVSDIFIHPSFSASTMENNIALFKLSDPVTYSKYIFPVCIPSDSASSGSTSWATMWAFLTSDGKFSQHLMQVSMPIVDDPKCSNSQICAGETKQSSLDCMGDGGGPLVVQKTDDRWYLDGITSHENGCGTVGVYTRTSSYYDWIKSVIKSN